MKILDELIRREGSAYTNDPTDRGGPTKYGITWKTLRQYRGQPAPAAGETYTQADVLAVQALDETTARDVYFVLFAKPFERFMIRRDLFELAVDSAVQHGVGRVQGWLKAIPSSDPDVNYAGLLRRRMQFYGEIVQADPSQARFIKGWLNRLGEFVR